MATITKYATANSGGTYPWTNPTYAYADDTSYATAIAASTNRDYIQFYSTYGMSIPIGATINSVTIYAGRFVSTTASTIVFGMQAYLGTATARGTEYTSALEPLTNPVEISTSTTGTWTVSELNTNSASGLNIRVRFRRTVTTSCTCSLDYVKVVVDYTPTNLYWIGGSGNSDDTAHWSETSGGATAGIAPSSGINAIFDNSSFSSGSATVTFNAAFSCKDMDWSAATSNSPAMVNTYADLQVFGNLHLGVVAQSGDKAILLKATGAGYTIATGSMNIANPIICDGSGGSWTLQNAINYSTSQGVIAVRTGTFNSGNYAISVYSFLSNYATGVRTINLGTSTITCADSFDMSDNIANLTIDASTCHITTNTFRSGGKSYHYVNLANSGSISGGGTVGEFVFTAGKTHTFTVSETWNLTTWSGNGTAGNLITVQSSSASTAFTVSMTSGTVTADYYTLIDCTGTGGAAFNYTANSTITRCTGWTAPATNVPVSDGLTPLITETATVTAAIPTSDGLTPKIDDVITFANIAVTYTDGLTPKIAETVSVNAAIPVSDSLTPLITESVALTKQIPLSDGLTPMITDSVVVGNIITISDGLTPKLQETTLEVSKLQVDSYSPVGYPTAYSNGTNAWSSQTNAYSEDNSNYALCGVSLINTDYIVFYSTFGFSIPSNATIISVTAVANWNMLVNGSSNSILGIQAFIGTGTSRGSENTTTAQPASDTDLSVDCGTWTYSELNTNSASGINIRLRHRQDALVDNIVNVDSVKVTVSYTVTGANDNVLFLTDTLLPTISESVSTVQTLALTDTLLPKTDESVVFANIAVAVSDGLLPKITDDIAISSTIPVSDGLTPVITESVALTKNIPLSDGLTPKIDETVSFANIAVAVSDSLTPLITDTIAVEKQFSVSDGLTPKIAESVAFANIAVSVSDTLLPKIDETVSTTAAIPVVDGLTPLITDSASVSAAIPVSDGLNPKIGDAVSTSASIPVSDGLLPKITESTPAFQDIAIAISDGLTPLIGDTVSVDVITEGTDIPVSDSLTPMISESISVQIYVLVSDSLTPVIADATSIVAAIPVSDNLIVVLSESVATVNTFAVVDSLTPIITDAVQLTVNLTMTDTSPPMLTESIQISESHGSTDALTPTLSESVSVAVSSPVSDSLTPMITDSVVVSRLLSLTDELKPVITESVDRQITLLLSDGLAVVLTDSVTLPIDYPVSDGLTPMITETIVLTKLMPLRDTLKIHVEDAPLVVTSAGVRNLDLEDTLTLRFKRINGIRAKRINGI